MAEQANAIEGFRQMSGTPAVRSLKLVALFGWVALAAAWSALALALPFLLPQCPRRLLFAHVSPASEPLMADEPHERMFPILRDRSITAIPWKVIAPHEKQARANHEQSLKGLAERGGLSLDEACAVLEDRKWREMDQDHARAILMALAWRFIREEREKSPAPKAP